MVKYDIMKIYIGIPLQSVCICALLLVGCTGKEYAFGLLRVEGYLLLTIFLLFMFFMYVHRCALKKKEEETDNHKKLVQYLEREKDKYRNLNDDLRNEIRKKNFDIEEKESKIELLSEELRKYNHIWLIKEKLEFRIVQLNDIKKGLMKEKCILVKRLEAAQKELDELYERNRTITLGESQVMLNRMKATKKLTKQDWNNILAITQTLYGHFVDNLTKENPQLKKDDIKICCLLKIGFTKNDIIEILDLKEDAMNKRMQRLKSRMSLKKKWGKNELQQYIEAL